MSWMSRLWNTVRPRLLDQELNEEMANHIERRAAELTQDGLTRDEAYRQACIRFGSVSGIREKSREVRLWPQVEATMKDLTYAIRGLRKQPAFGVTAIVSLALSMTSVSAIYSIVDAAILRPLPVYRPGELFTLTYPDISDSGFTSGNERDSFSYPEFLSFRDATGAAVRLALYSFPGPVEVKGLRKDKLTRAFTSGNGFDMLGIAPAAGRLFSAAEDKEPTPVAVISYDLWSREFHRDPDVFKRNLRIDGKLYGVIGVARKTFFGVEPGKFVDIWLPASEYDAAALSRSDWHWFRILERITPGYGTPQIQARLQVPFHALRADIVKRNPTAPEAVKKQFLQSHIHVREASSGVSSFRQSFSRPLWIVFAVAWTILLIACANVAGLLLARSTARAGEMAMRIALGAGRWRLMRQMFTESLLLACLGGILGWLLARFSAPFLASWLSTGDDPLQLVLAPDTRVLAFCAGIFMLASLIFGIIPAWRASGAQPIAAVRESAGQSQRMRLSKAFVVVQVACAFCLVIAGAAFLFSLGRLFKVDPGFNVENVTVLTVTHGPVAQPKNPLQHMFDLQRRLSAAPGIESVAAAPWPNFDGGGWSGQVIIPGRGPSQQEEIFYPVSPNYFATLHTPLLKGRDFTARDSAAKMPTAAIVNRAFAEKYFNTADVVGRGFSFPSEKGLMRKFIVGVASDVRYSSLRKPVDPIVYLPLDDDETTFSPFVRSRMEVGSIVRLVNREAAQAASGYVDGVTTLDAIVGKTLRTEKLLAGVGGALAFFGLLLAAIGLFGILSYSVGRRTREIGIRGALGADAAEIVAMILKDVTILMSTGVIAGFAMAMVLVRMVRPLLFEVHETDPVLLATAVIVFAATGLIAASMPARHAAAIDPVTALRSE